MRKYIVPLGLIFFFSLPVVADDIMHATSEDILEFDQLLADQPDIKKDGKKTHKSKGEKGKHPPRNRFKGHDKEKQREAGGEKDMPPPRQQFKNGENQKQMLPPEGRERRSKGPPRDDRERGRRKPPSKPGGGPPPPPQTP